MTRINSVFWALAGALAAAALGLALLGASAYGKRRERRAWLTEQVAA